MRAKAFSGGWDGDGRVHDGEVERQDVGCGEKDVVNLGSNTKVGSERSIQ